MRCIACNNVQVDTEIGLRAPFVVERAVTAKALYSNRCEACNCRWSTPRLTDKELGLLYLNYRSPEYDKMRERHETDYAERKHQHLGFRDNTRAAEYMLQPYLKAPRILDVGGYDGLNTPLRHIAETHHIFDIDDASPVEGAQIVKLPDPPYDLVVLSHVLEHVSDPFEFLRDWSQHSSKIVYVEVPLADIPKAPLFWHEHQTMFSVPALVMLLKRLKLNLLDLKIKNKSILTVSRVPLTRVR